MPQYFMVGQQTAAASHFFNVELDGYDIEVIADEVQLIDNKVWLIM